MWYMVSPLAVARSIYTGETRQSLEMRLKDTAWIASEKRMMEKLGIAEHA